MCPRPHERIANSTSVFHKHTNYTVFQCIVCFNWYHQYQQNALKIVVFWELLSEEKLKTLQNRSSSLQSFVPCCKFVIKCNTVSCFFFLVENICFSHARQLCYSGERGLPMRDYSVPSSENQQTYSNCLNELLQLISLFEFN